jgi:ribosome-associated translation inhibitor RaiA
MSLQIIRSLTEAEVKRSTLERMKELDFTLEFSGQGFSDQMEAALVAEAHDQLRDLAADQDDLTGAAISIRRPAQAETSFIYEATVVVYARPKPVAATKKEADPMTALKNSLNAIERQVREKRRKLRDRWEQPGNDPVSVEVEEIMAAEGEGDESSRRDAKSWREGDFHV